MEVLLSMWQLQKIWPLEQRAKPNSEILEQINKHLHISIKGPDDYMDTIISEA